MFCLSGHSQSITTAEYFFDSDPGTGNGIPVVISSGTEWEIPIPATVIAPGFHHLSFRFKNDLGQWCHSESRLFYIQPTTEMIYWLTDGEYFFDNDPGIGSGIPFSFTADDTINTEKSIDLAGLSEGFHRLSVRLYNEHKTFSLSESRLFYVSPATTATDKPKLVAIEYCIDDTPGNGNEISVAVTETDSIDVILNLPMTGIEAGKHTIAFRVINTEGTCSYSVSDTFHINTAIDLPPVPPSPPSDSIVACASDVPPPIDLTAIDDHDGEIMASPTDEYIPGDCPNNFSIERTWKFVDGNGNSASVSQTIIVVDNIPPVVLCQNITVELDAMGIANIMEADIDNGSFDLCSNVSLTLDRYSFTCADIGKIKVLLSVKDDCDNTSQCEAIVTVVDKIPPEISCLGTALFYVDNYETNYTVQGEELDANASDACGVASLTYTISGATTGSGESMSGIELNSGNNTIIWTAIDDFGNQTSCSSNVTILKRPTSLSYIGDMEEQYSDPTNLKAILIDDISGAGIAGKTLAFSIGSQSITAKTDENGIAEANLILNQSPQLAYSVNVTFNGDDTYLGCSDFDFFDITHENSLINYIGTELAATISATNLSATIDLRAVLMDIADDFRGDITNASVQFVNLDDNSIILDWTPVIDLIDPFTGVVSTQWLVKLPDNQSSQMFTVGTNVNNYYWASDVAIITLYMPEGEFITGGGNIKPTSSAGLYLSDTETKTNFGFNIKFNKKGKNLQGKLNFIWRSGGKTYQAKSNATLTLGVNTLNQEELVAEFTSKCNVLDITDPLNPIELGGNKIMHVSMTDCGEPGNTDHIAFTLWDDNILWYSSDWTGLQTEEIFLNGGNLVVHTNSISEALKVGQTLSGIDSDILYSDLKIYPNPSKEVIYIELINIRTPCTIELINVSGQTVVLKEIYSSFEKLELNNLARGTYLLKVYSKSFYKTEKINIQ